MPAYKFTAFTVIKQRETLTDSAEAIRKMLEAPLKKELTVRELTKSPEVKVSGGRPNLPAVIFVPDSRGGSTTGAGQEGLQQQGGPFFGTDVTWYMSTRHPAAAEKAPTEKAATAEKEEAADTPEKPEKGPTKKRQPR